MSNYIYTWVDFDSDLDVIKKNIRKEYDTVVGISKGGLPLAVKVANILKLPLKVVEARSYTNRGRGNLVVEQFNPIPWGPRVLLVDDICDSGNTLFSITETLKVWKKKVETLTLIKRENSKFKPTYRLHELPKGIWVEFPWE